MKQHSFLLLFLLLSINSIGQLEKRTWLVGGSGNFLTSKTTYNSPNYSSKSDRLDVKISPGIGYFFYDKFAAGLKLSYSKYKENFNGNAGIQSNTNRFEFGPFVRYYFLNTENQYNILLDLCYQYGLYSSKPTKGDINTFSFSAGTVIYFNSAVGIELMPGYYSRKEVIKQNGDMINKQSGFQLNIGFQIHLQKLD